MANAEQIEAPKGPSLIVQVAMLAAMTVAALGVGWMSGSYLKSSEAPPSVPAAGMTNTMDRMVGAPSRV